MILLYVYAPDGSYMGTMLSVLMCADIDECALETDRCDQNCQNTVGNYTCSCRTGYILSGRFTCLSEQKKKKKNLILLIPHVKNNYIPDIDECTLGIDVCHQTCADMEGSYTCRCRLGYTLDTDGHSCNGIMHS